MDYRSEPCFGSWDPMKNKMLGYGMTKKKDKKKKKNVEKQRETVS